MVPTSCSRPSGTSPDGFPGHVPGSKCSWHHCLEYINWDLEHWQAAHDAHKHDEGLKLQLESLLEPLMHWIFICARKYRESAWNASRGLSGGHVNATHQAISLISFSHACDPWGCSPKGTQGINNTKTQAKLLPPPASSHPLPGSGMKIPYCLWPWWLNSQYCEAGRYELDLLLLSQQQQPTSAQLCSPNANGNVHSASAMLKLQKQHAPWEAYQMKQRGMFHVRGQCRRHQTVREICSFLGHALWACNSSLHQGSPFLETADAAVDSSNLGPCFLLALDTFAPSVGANVSDEVAGATSAAAPSN